MITEEMILSGKLCMIEFSGSSEPFFRSSKELSDLLKSLGMLNNSYIVLDHYNYKFLHLRPGIYKGKEVVTYGELANRCNIMIRQRKIKQIKERMK